MNVQVFDKSDERQERVIKRTATLYLDLLQPRLQKGRLMPAGRHNCRDTACPYCSSIGVKVPPLSRSVGRWNKRVRSRRCDGLTPGRFQTRLSTSRNRILSECCHVEMAF